MASQQGIRRRSSAADRTPHNHLNYNPMTRKTTEYASHDDHSASSPTLAYQPNGTTPIPDPALTDGAPESMQPPPAPQDDDGSPTRPSRSTSAASRHANRLSLTLPVALPTSDPSRPTPTSAPLSVTSTPVETATVFTPSDPNEFIIAIAAQERKVLELREGLACAEAELSSLKRRWTAQESYHKRVASQHAELHRVGMVRADDEAAALQRSVETDRRKLMFHNQGTPTQGTPTQGRRRVMRGGHTRALSLLSPTKSESDFPFRDDPNETEVSRSTPFDRRITPQTTPNLPKRASWQPRSSHHHSKSSVGVPQLVEDFKLGLRAFVEDIRQITVGDEPISGSPPSSGEQQERLASKEQQADPSRSRPTHAARPRVSTVFDSTGNTTSTPSSPNKGQDTGRERPRSGKSKHFSWTPLGFDALDDNDWSNWDSPGPTKSARWSGSTINSSGIEEIQSIPEVGEETVVAVKRNPEEVGTPIRSPKLDELLPSMVNRLSPSNIKRTATNLMEEWEKSLVSPEERDKENTV